jgi:hypothetical protein
MVVRKTYIMHISVLSESLISSFSGIVDCITEKSSEPYATHRFNTFSVTVTNYLDLLLPLSPNTYFHSQESRRVTPETISNTILDVHVDFQSQAQMCYEQVDRKHSFRLWLTLDDTVVGCKL